MEKDEIGRSKIETKKTFAPRILMGGLQQGEDDQQTPGLVAASYPSREKADFFAQYLLSIQDGTTPFTISPNVRSGDNVIKVDISPKPTEGKGYLCTLRAKADPKHLTYGFYVASYVTEQEFESFSTFLEMTGHYIFTVAHEDKLMVDNINLIKYIVTRRGV